MDNMPVILLHLWAYI